MPPCHSRRIGVIDERAVSFPPFDGSSIVDEVSVGFAKGIQILVVTGCIGQAVGRINEVRHPKHKAHVSLVQVINHAGRIRIPFLVKTKIVVSRGPGAVDQDGAEWQIMIATAINQIPNSVRRVHIILPHPRPH